MQFNHVVCGGTFDHLHLGHKKLLEECIRQGKRVTVGVTTRAMIRHKAYRYSIQSYSTRVKNISQNYPTLSFFKLHDIYGPTLSDTSIDAICVTQDTLFGAELINKKRKEVGMTALSLIMVPFIYDENNEKISSDRIRQGILDRRGKRYDTYLFSKERHILPELLRGILRQPLGHTLSSFSKLSKNQIKGINSQIEKRGYFYYCAVGDIVTFELKKRGIIPFISVIDGMTKRKALNRKIMEEILEKGHIDAINKRGTIQKGACIEVQKLLNMGHDRAIKQLLIQGEEDLLTLAVVLLAPLGAHVWYGQQGVGVVDIRVTEKKKQTVYNLLRQFN